MLYICSAIFTSFCCPVIYKHLSLSLDKSVVCYRCGFCRFSFFTCVYVLFCWYSVHSVRRSKTGLVCTGYPQTSHNFNDLMGKLIKFFVPKYLYVFHFVCGAALFLDFFATVFISTYTMYVCHFLKFLHFW